MEGFNRLKVGDIVTATYFEAVAVRLALFRAAAGGLDLRHVHVNLGLARDIIESHGGTFLLDNNGQPDIFVRDLQDGVTRLLSQTGAGDAGDRSSFPALFSADGHTVAFGSAATDLFPGDLNLNLDLFATSVPASAAGDTDNDGLADAWELYHLGTLGWGQLDDPDGDGMSNLAEQSAGMVPWDPASALRLAALPRS